MSIEDALWVHCLTIATLLAIVAYRLFKRKKFSIMYSGFWVWAAILLYLLLNPLVSLLAGRMDKYERFLRESGGGERVIWVLCVLVIAIIFYYGVYDTKKSWRKKSTNEVIQDWPKGTIYIVFIFLTLALRALLVHRTGTAFVEQSFSPELDKGRFVGEITGYQTASHMLALYPITLMLYGRTKAVRNLGIAALVGFIAIKMYDAWDRMSVVAIIIAAIIVIIKKEEYRDWVKGLGDIRKGKMKASHIVLVAMLVGMTIFLIQRGHSSISEYDRNESGNPIVELFSSRDTAMLPTLYLRSYVIEKSGYDYGATIFTKLIFGSLPRKYFPWKDEPLKWILGENGQSIPKRYEIMLYGSKSLIFGSLYRHGNIYGVIIGMIIAAIGTRKLDQIVNQRKEIYIKVIGIVWMSMIWILFASSDVWCVNKMFISAIPFVPLWLSAKIFGIRKTRQKT
jgi:oligosaccharide repeat unit polymerase